MNKAVGSSNTAVRSRLPPGIGALGVVLLPMDVSSETIHALLPVDLVGDGARRLDVVGRSDRRRGLATAAITKVFSGVLSDGPGQGFQPSTASMTAKPAT